MNDSFIKLEMFYAGPGKKFPHVKLKTKWAITYPPPRPIIKALRHVKVMNSSIFPK